MNWPIVVLHFLDLFHPQNRTNEVLTYPVPLKVRHKMSVELDGYDNAIDLAT